MHEYLFNLHACFCVCSHSSLPRQGPRSNFWIEGGPNVYLPRGKEGAGEGAVATMEHPFLLRPFSICFPFLLIFKVFFLNYLAVATCSCLLLGFFRSLLVNIGKNICMFFRHQSFCLLLLDFRVRFPKITAIMLMRCS